MKFVYTCCYIVCCIHLKKHLYIRCEKKSKKKINKKKNILSTNHRIYWNKHSLIIYFTIHVFYELTYEYKFTEMQEKHMFLLYISYVYLCDNL